MRSSKKRSRKPRSARNKQVSYENLEERRMLATAYVLGDLLYVSGTDQAETLSVSRDDNEELVVFSDPDGDSGPAQGSFIPINVTQGSALADVVEIQIVGRAGDDLLVNQTELNSRIDGGFGDDTIVGGTGNDRALLGGPGNDLIEGDFGINEAVTPGAGGNDLIAGGDGEDTLVGKGGNDVLLGEDGDDLLLGGADRDRLFGGEGTDQISGDGGDDLAFGGEGDDFLSGGFGNDVLNGGVGNDNILPGAGNDLLNGQEGNDFLQSNSGDLGGTNVLVGGVGNDRYRFFGQSNFGGTDIVQERSAEGNDTLIVEVAGAYVSDQFGVNILSYGPIPGGFLRNVFAVDQGGNPLAGNIEFIQGAQEIPDLSFPFLTPGSAQFSFIATDEVGISLNRSAGILTNVRVGLLNPNGTLTLVMLDDLAPVTVTQLDADTYRFGYNITQEVFGSPPFNPLTRPTISFVTAELEEGQVTDNHGNENLRTGFTFGG